MLHEAMMLEYSGRYLGLMHWAVMVKQTLLFTMFINLFVPWGISIEYTLSSILIGLFFYIVKVIVVGVLLAAIETAYAKVRLFMIPKLLVSSMALSILAIVVQIAR